MASGASDYFENKLLDLYFRGVAYVAPTTLYIGLHSATPSDSGGGTEVTATGYARVGVTASTSNFAAGSGTNGLTSNSSTINFGTWTTGPTTVVGFGIYDASTAGNLLFWGDLTASKTIGANDAVSLPVGNLTCTFS